VNPLAPLLFLFALGRAKGGGFNVSPPGRGRPPRPRPNDPHDYTNVQPTPAAYKPAGPSTEKPWLTYPNPIPAAVINRAQALLKDHTVHEQIEKDPSTGGTVRYLRTTDNPPGHTSVTAWIPNPNYHGPVPAASQAPHSSASSPASPPAVLTAMHAKRPGAAARSRARRA
jgi:hypothetical protein